MYKDGELLGSNVQLDMNIQDSWMILEHADHLLGFRPPTTHCLFSLNNHDTHNVDALNQAPFAKSWVGLDRV